MNEMAFLQPKSPPLSPKPAPRVIARAAVDPVEQYRVPSIVHDVLRQPGQPLDPAARAAQETRFGQDFSQVRVHTGGQAAESARSVSAQAYTVGRDIVFGAGRYAPASPEGQRLLAHELTHTLQQGPSAPRLPDRVSAPGDASEREAAALSSSAAALAAPAAAPGMQPAAPVQAGTLQRQEENKPPDPKPNPKPDPNPVQNKSPDPQPQPDPQQKKAAEEKPKESPAGDLKTQVTKWLDQQNVDLPAAADPPNTNNGLRRVFYGGQMYTLDKVTDDVTDVLGQKNPGLKRSDVWSEVWQYYNKLRQKADSASNWSAVVQIQYTPQYTLLSNKAIDNPAQHSFQISGGANYRFHGPGASGTELTLQANVSLLNLTAPQSPYFYDVFQNATVSAQAQQVWNLGKDFRLPGTAQWANLQASAFAQVALGVGSNYSTAAGDRKLFVGFLAQPSAGGQINLNVGWFQVILNGSVVYSYLSPTSEAKSTPTHSLAVQGGIGIGGQFN